MEKRVTPAVRREIVHTIGIMMIASSNAVPTTLDCERTANAIVTKYPFLTDPFGSSVSVKITL
jgi:hypothetical protein